MKRLSATVGLAGMILAGLLAALTLTPAALAWSPDNLPPGWTVSHGTDVNPASTCPEWYRINAYDNGRATAVSNPLCVNSPTYQQDFDAFIDARYTAPAATVVITTPPTVTSTTASAPAPAPTAPATTTTNLNTAVTTATPVEQSLQAQIDTLTAQLAALTDRVTRIEKAGDAAWLAFEQAVAGGATIPDAADQARGTWLNVVYQLGPFAP